MTSDSPVLFPLIVGNGLVLLSVTVMQLGFKGSQETGWSLLSCLLPWQVQ